MSEPQTEFFSEFYQDPASPAEPAAAPAPVPATEAQPAAPAGDTPEAAAAPPETPQPTDRDAKLKALVDQYAQEEKETLQGLSPEAQQRLLRRLAEKELVVQETRSQAQPETEALTPFEQELLQKATAPAQAKPPDTPPAPALTTAPAQGQFVGANWKTSADAVLDHGKAWTAYSQAVEQGDFSTQQAALNHIAAIEDAAFMGRFSQARPVIEQYIQQRIDAALGGVLPEVSEIAQERAIKTAQDLAIQDLAATPGMEKIAETLFQKGEGTIAFNGQKVDNTPLNRVIKENPWILDIKVEHQDPHVANRLTMTKMYKAAHQLLTRGNTTPVAAKALVQAGQEMERRTEQEKFRQGINGGGANTAPPAAPDYIDQIKARAGRGLNMADL